ncbi:dihydroxyacetone kinase phosphoryl donor subunit DhaM [Nocardia sp. CDC153]|uniref:dihydroxyacetone kinase phosphoryl donor subunit DhaM n=1 Tax=Nocardia sp. CDC153 TaxID=3112167 RepID=UPI002DBEC6A1|nr:dihydroxyacetone kinase phosphoryl donor subunit DhaM [Nocardia sp. CDC153]MEC3958180.1 dihydroxyacetone kinase phosphoryl donor subunit DhaM [Nocardia sp. CDC153]
MIGLVVVSHSRALAEAAVALAAGLLPDQGVAIRIAAGLHDNELGTDAVAVADAIAAADSGDGVLVLMDLGSAVLSAETALDLLESAVEVTLSAAPLVEGLLSALAAAGGGADLRTVAREAENALAAKRGQLGESPEGAVENDPQVSTGVRPVDDSVIADTFPVSGEHGLHARPAAELVAALREFDADVRLRNATTGAGPVPGDSLTRVLTLGVLPGQLLEVTATGTDAAAAVARVRALIDGH